MNHNEPAYPVDELQQSVQGIAVQHFGMTIRMRYAMAAMQGLVANSNMVSVAIGTSRRASIVQEAWALADAMVIYQKDNPQ